MRANLVRYLVLTLVGVFLARALVKVDGIRRAMHFATHPVLLAEQTPSEETETTSSLTPDNSPSPRPAHPHAARRISWEELDRRRPKDPETDPTVGKTQILYLDAPLEMRLSSVLADAHCGLPVLRLGVVTVGGHSCAGVEFWCGAPPSRTAIEQTAVKIIHLCFETQKSLDEVDVVAVPWRTVKGYKPPSYFSVAARRVDYVPSSENLVARQVLDRFGAAWWDPRVMSDFPVPATPAVRTTARTP